MANLTYEQIINRLNDIEQMLNNRPTAAQMSESIKAVNKQLADSAKDYLTVKDVENINQTLTHIMRSITVLNASIGEGGSGGLPTDTTADDIPDGDIKVIMLLTERELLALLNLLVQDLITDLGSLTPRVDDLEIEQVVQNNDIINLNSNKQNTLVSGGNIKTVNSESLLGSGNILIGGSDPTKLAIVNNLSDLGNIPTARTNLGLGTLATQNGTFSGSSSGNNSGDQNTIVGINGTKTEFDTALTDGSFLYAGDIIGNIPTALSPGTVTPTSYGITSDGGIDDIVLPQASITEAGLLSASDKVKLNNTSGSNSGDDAPNSLYSGLVSNATHTGDATGDIVLTLATVNANVGSFGDASNVAQVTLNGKGLVTAGANVPIQITESQVTNLTTDLLGKQASLVSGTNIKTLNSVSLLGSGNIALVKADVGLSNVDNTEDVNKPVSTAQGIAINAKVENNLTASTTVAPAKDAVNTALGLKINSSEKGAANGVAPLDALSKIASVYLPAITITGTSVVASQAAMLALVAETGDIAVRTDQSKSYILAGTDSTILGNWQELLSPTGGGITSVNGQPGPTVSLTTDNIPDFADKRYTTQAQQTILGNTSNTNTGDETGARIATLLHASANKSALVDADEVNGTDSANSFSLIRTTWLQVKAFLKTYFDTLYPSGSGTSIGNNTGDNATNTQYSSLVSNATHTGDVVGDTALTISNNAVTNAKFAQMATKTYKGRTSAGTGNAEDINVATLKTDLSLNNVDNTSNATERSAVRTLENARITQRVSTEVSNATPSIDSDSVDVHAITALAVPITSLTITGTPTPFQKLIIVIKDNGTAKAIDISAGASASGNQPLITTTVSGVEVSLLLQRNITNTDWIQKSIS